MLLRRTKEGRAEVTAFREGEGKRVGESCVWCSALAVGRIPKATECEAFVCC